MRSNYALLLLVLVTAMLATAQQSSATSDPNIYRKLLRALGYADIFRASLVRVCLALPNEGRNATIISLCKQPTSISEDLIESVAEPLMKRFVPLGEADLAFKFWSSSEGASISQTLVRETRENNPTLLKPSQLNLLTEANDSSYGRALSRFAKDKAAAVEIMKAVAEKLPSPSN